MEWTDPQRFLKVGDLVLFSDELTAPEKWPMWRVTNFFPGDDIRVGVTEIKTFKTATTTSTRRSFKLVLLCEHEEL